MCWVSGYRQLVVVRRAREALAVRLAVRRAARGAPSAIIPRRLIRTVPAHTSDQIEACEDDLKAFAATHGVEAFVRTAHIYVRGRVDHQGFGLHKQLLAEGRLSPATLIRLLADGAEFRTSGRRLAAPNSPDFPFRLRW